MSAGDAVVATLAYRLAAYWLPLPVGAVAYVVHSRIFPASLRAASELTTRQACSLRSWMPV